MTTSSIKKQMKTSAPTHNIYSLTDEDFAMNHNFQSESEVVAKYIIEKLISLTMTYNTRNIIDDQIPDHCFNFFHRMFTDLLQEEYIAYDRDDMFAEVNNEQIFFDNRFSGVNDWNSLAEPHSSKIDRAASTYIKVLRNSPKTSAKNLPEIKEEKKGEK